MSKKSKAAKKIKTAQEKTRAVKKSAPVAQAQAQAEPKADALDVREIADAPMLEANPGTLTADAEPDKTLPSEESAADSSAESFDESPTPPPARETEPLRLPRGAFLALRKSGGLHFSARALVLYPDGRASYDERGVPQKEYNRLPRVLNDGQVLSLRKLLDQTNFWRAESSGEQNPDAFAYEIAARLGQRSNNIQVFDGSIPDKLKPLLERLTPLLPRDEA